MNVIKNSKIVLQDLIGRITAPGDPGEVQATAFTVMQSLFGVTRTDIMAGKMISVQTEALRKLDNFVGRINAHEPVQYIVGEAYFYGRSFKVNPSVLIPRPETEMLVRTVLDWKIAASENQKSAAKLMDIGTGSGCIPITLYHEWQDAQIFATDVSVSALEVARLNAKTHNANVTFMQHNILCEDIDIDRIDVIVSNPPYVTMSESASMDRNVLEFEPHQALFVPDDDPLVFYREILAKARRVISPGGLLAVEINARFGNEVAQLFKDNAFADIIVLNDIDGKQRIVRGIYDSV